jgi:hypothetical protein
LHGGGRGQRGYSSGQEPKGAAANPRVDAAHVGWERARVWWWFRMQQQFVVASDRQGFSQGFLLEKIQQGLFLEKISDKKMNALTFSFFYCERTGGLSCAAPRLVRVPPTADRPTRHLPDVLYCWGVVDWWWCHFPAKRP